MVCSLWVSTRFLTFLKLSPIGSFTRSQSGLFLFVGTEGEAIGSSVMGARVRTGHPDYFRAAAINPAKFQIKIETDKTGFRPGWSLFASSKNKGDMALKK
jgi:hypothetical protein